MLCVSICKNWASLQIIKIKKKKKHLQEHVPKSVPLSWTHQAAVHRGNSKVNFWLSQGHLCCLSVLVMSPAEATFQARRGNLFWTRRQVHKAHISASATSEKKLVFHTTELGGAASGCDEWGTRRSPSIFHFLSAQHTEPAKWQKT